MVSILDESQTNLFVNSQGLDVYQKILNNNHMGHHEIYSILHKFLISYFQKPFSLLELGCGDARFSSRSLLNTNLVSYKGIDLSEIALKIAQKNMTDIPHEKTFTQGNFFQLVPELVKF